MAQCELSSLSTTCTHTAPPNHCDSAPARRRRDSSAAHPWRSSSLPPPDRLASPACLGSFLGAMTALGKEAEGKRRRGCDGGRRYALFSREEEDEGGLLDWKEGVK